MGSRMESKGMPEMCQNQNRLKGRKEKTKIRVKEVKDEEKKRQRGRKV